MSNITIVTAFFDIGRGQWNKTSHGFDTPHYIPRTTDSYFGYFENLAKVKNDMVIYCAKEHVDRIKEIRNKNVPNANTTVVSFDFNESVKSVKPIIELIQSRPEYINLIKDPRMPEYWNADYVLVNLMKTDFVIAAYNANHIKTELVAWLDFGYVRSEQTLPKSRIWNYNFNPNKMHYFNKRDIDFQRPIFDIIRHNDVYIMGCHIVGGKTSWHKHQQYNHESMMALLRCGLIDDDQTFMLMNYRMRPEEFELHPIEVKEEEWNEWNVAMLKYNSAAPVK